MSKVLIIGAGGVGSVVTHKCAGVPDVFSEICLASRTIVTGQALVDRSANLRVHCWVEAEFIQPF